MSRIWNLECWYLGIETLLTTFTWIFQMLFIIAMPGVSFIFYAGIPLRKTWMRSFYRTTIESKNGGNILLRFDCVQQLNFNWLIAFNLVLIGLIIDPVWLRSSGPVQPQDVTPALRCENCPKMCWLLQDVKPAPRCDPVNFPKMWPSKLP